jgi:hypothetical protein
MMRELILECVLVELANDAAWGRLPSYTPEEVQAMTDIQLLTLYDQIMAADD